MNHKWARSIHEWYHGPIIIYQAHCGKLFKKGDERVKWKWKDVECKSCLKGKP